MCYKIITFIEVFLQILQNLLKLIECNTNITILIKLNDNK